MEAPISLSIEKMSGEACNILARRSWVAADILAQEPVQSMMGDATWRSAIHLASGTEILTGTLQEAGIQDGDRLSVICSRAPLVMCVGDEEVWFWKLSYPSDVTKLRITYDNGLTKVSKCGNYIMTDMQSLSKVGVWNIETRDWCVSIQERDRLMEYDMSNKGNTYMTCVKGRCTIWDVSGNVVRAFEDDIDMAAYTVDDMVLTAGTGKAALWSIEHGMVRVFHHRDTGYCHVETAGNLVMTEITDEIKLWNMNGEELMSMRNVDNTCMREGGRMVAITVGSEITIYDADARACTTMDAGHEVSAQKIYNDVLVTGGEDGTAKVWNITSMQLMYEVHIGEEVSSVALLQNYLLTTSDTKVTVWEGTRMMHEYSTTFVDRAFFVE